MSYTAEIKRSAEKEMDRLPDKIHKRISDRILALETNPRPPGSKNFREKRAIVSGSGITGCSILSTTKRDTSSFTVLPTGGKHIGKEFRGQYTKCGDGGSNLYLCKTRLQREIEAADRQIDQLVYEV